MAGKVKVREVASLHPKTVAKAGEHKRRRRPPTTKVSTLQVVKVHELVWKTALKLADGDPYRLLIRSPLSVTVLNHPIRGALRLEREIEWQKRTDTPTTKSTPDDLNDDTDQATTPTIPR